MLLFTKNDRLANWLIGTLSIVVFATVVALNRIQLDVNLGFNIHVFARTNAVLNTAVSVLLLAGLITARRRQFIWHQRIMLTAVGLSALFLLSYIAHHLLADSTRFGCGSGSVCLFHYPHHPYRSGCHHIAFYPLHRLPRPDRAVCTPQAAGPGYLADLVLRIGDWSGRISDD